MTERDGYIPGVPCWIDTTQPDPEAAARFYERLFGWEFENVMPPGSEVKYLIGRIRGGDVAAVSSRPEGAPPEGGVEHVRLGGQCGRDRREGAGGRRARPERAVRRDGQRPDGRVHRS